MAIRQRLDLTDWVIHFVHDRVYKNETAYVLGERFDYTPYDFIKDHERRFEHWDLKDKESSFSCNADALTVILRILVDGTIRRGWAFRNNRPTIYGPKAACCFTEMPLYALLEYSKARTKTSTVLPYGIALLREELFRAGGRPVIYGLTGEHREMAVESMPRMLHRSCGIEPWEQYRYVAMNLDKDKWMDWSHEREWRWCDPKDRCSCPGLPIWLKAEPIKFSRSLIMVKEEWEVPIILDKIKELHDAGYSNYYDMYDKAALRRSQVFSLEGLSSLDRVMKLDDLPSTQLSTFKKPSPSSAYIRRLRQVLEQASASAAVAAKDYRENHPRSQGGHYRDVFGFASLEFHAPQSEFTEALILLDVVKVIGGVGYSIMGVFERHCSTMMLTEFEMAANAARDVLRENYPDVHFYVSSRMD